MTCKWLDGEKIDMSSVSKRRELEGKRIQYLRKQDIDRSGRGYFFPRSGFVKAAIGKNLEFDNGEYEYAGDIVEARFL